MKTDHYNPSKLEVEFANAIHNLREKIQDHLTDNKITHIFSNVDTDNPVVSFHLEDKDGDSHELVVQIIQKPDRF